MVIPSLLSISGNSPTNLAVYVVCFSSLKNHWFRGFPSMLALPCCSLPLLQEIPFNSLTPFRKRVWNILGLFKFCRLMSEPFEITVDVLFWTMLCCFQRSLPFNSIRSIIQGHILSRRFCRHVRQVCQRRTRIEFLFVRSLQIHKVNYIWISFFQLC